MSGNSVKMLHVTNPFFERSSTIELTNQYPTPQKARILFKAITIAITPFPQPQQNKAKCQKSLLGNKRHNTLYIHKNVNFHLPKTIYVQFMYVQAVLNLVADTLLLLYLMQNYCHQLN
jgi:hypothetical protein